MNGKGKSKFALIVLGVIAIVVALNMRKEQTVPILSNAVYQRQLPIYCVEKDAPVVALTFDAAWGNEDTRRILDILEQEDVKVTFFMTGGWVEKYPEDVKLIYEAGHELGNHSQSHYDMTTISATQMQQEILQVHESVLELTGYEMKVFRCPYGAYNDSVILTAQQCGYRAIQWDVDSLDWKDYGRDSIITTVCQHKNLGNGSIILCHNGSKYTADALEELIQNLKAQGYTFVTVSELIDPDSHNIDVNGRQHKE